MTMLKCVYDLLDKIKSSCLLDHIKEKIHRQIHSLNNLENCLSVDSFLTIKKYDKDLKFYIKIIKKYNYMLI